MTRLAALFVSLRYGLVALIATALTGCGLFEERIIEKPTPIKIPTLCLKPCLYATGAPLTNGGLALQWRERGEALECYESRMQCVRELAQ